MKVKVNGEYREFPEGTTVRELLSLLGIEPRGVAVEINREIVPKGLHADRRLNEGDAVEIVRMVGGG